MPRIVRIDGPNVALRTLDIADRQLLINLEPRHAGCGWEHHVAFGRVRDALWVCLDTDLILAPEDLGLPGTAVMPLVRKTRFPEGERPLLTFDELTDEQIAGLRARAFAMIDMLGGVIPVAGLRGGPDAAWFYSDPGHERFNTEVEIEITSDASRFEVRGSVALSMLMVDGEEDWTTAQRIKPSDHADWLLEKREGAGRDPRILKLRRPPAEGSRVLFSDAVSAMKTPTIGPLLSGKIFPVTELLLPEVIQSLADSGVQPQQFVSSFLQNFSIGPKSGLALELTYIILALWMLVCIDHLDILQLVTAEHLGRRAMQIMKAIERNPKAPEFAGLSSYMLHAHLASGVPYTPAWDKCIGERNRLDAQFAKHSLAVQDSEKPKRDQDNNKNKEKDKKPKGAGKGADPG